SLFAQLGHVSRYPSVFSSPYSLLLGEATALYLAGVLFQELKHATEWRRLGRLLLLREMKRQISSEGIHNELSSYYHCYALDFYLQVLVLAMNNELVWPDPVWQRLAGMMEFLMHLTRPDGTIPLLGDDDGGRALALSKTHYRSFQDALCAGAVLYGRPDFKYVAGEFCEETLWLLGEKAWHIYASMQGSQPCALQAFYPAAGYFIQRSDWGATANHLVFDCGKMGMIRGGHGHADALSIVLSEGGKELLVDPGTSIYNSAPAWRDFFRSSRAHNTATVDYREQSETGRTFSWKQIAQTRLCQQITRFGIEYVEGEHDGYCRLPQGIVHRRGVLHCRPHCWVIVDRFQGEGRHRFDLHYHFPSEAEVSFCEGSEINPEIDLLARAESANLRLFLCSSAPQKAEIISGRTKSIQGWVSRRYGERKPAPTLAVSMESSAPAVMLSLLLPLHTNTKVETARHGDGTYKIQRVEAEKGVAVACALEWEEGRDLWVVITSDEETKVLGYKMRGEFFWVHSDTRGRKQLFAINAIHFSDDGRPILQNGDAHTCILLRWDDDGDAVEQCKEGEEALCAGYAAL
ncbi:MAG: alginate lyase family protein, partial [Acidobacteria bacterium]|nr:alginate lyase family protein [Acidobacteriota bacterium]